MKNTFRVLLTALIMITIMGFGTALATETTLVTDEAASSISAELIGFQVSSVVTEPNPYINVTGSATVTVKPDVANITLGVTFEDKDSSKAQSQTNTVMNTIIKRFTQMGIKKDNMTTQQITIYPVYDYKDGQQTLKGYQATQMINVRMTNLDNVGKVLDAAVKAGANQVYNVNFALRNTTKSYNEALQKAILDAKSKADIMAKAAGMTVDKVVTISENSSYSYSQPQTAYLAMDAERNSASNNSTSTLPGMISVSATVAITYSLK